MPPSAPTSRIYRQGTSLFDATTGQQLDNTATQNALKFATYDLGRIAEFDPKTDKTLVTAPTDAVTSSSGTLPQDEKKVGADITAQSSPAYVSPASNDYIAKIDAQSAALEQRRIQEEASIQAQFDALKTSTEGKQASETGYTSAGLARMGGYLGDSGSGTGVLLNLAQTHRNEMQSLESKRQSALADARNAYTDKQFQLAQLKATEAKSVEKEIYDRQQAYNKAVAEANKKTTDAAAIKKTQTDIYNAIASGKTDPLEIYQELGGNTSIEDINNFLTKSTPKDAKGDFAYTAAQTAKLLGSGLGIKDIKAAQDYINVHGYDDAFRGQLSGAQKVAFDSVYREKAAGVKPAEPIGQLEASRINEAYPGANVFPDDTPAEAYAKTHGDFSPEGMLKNEVIKEKSNGTSYEDAVSMINSNKNITDKESSIAIVKQVYGVIDTPPEDVINASNINQYKVVDGKFVKDPKYVAPPTDTLSKGGSDPFGFIGQIGNFLWKVGK